MNTARAIAHASQSRTLISSGISYPHRRSTAAVVRAQTNTVPTLHRNVTWGGRPHRQMGEHAA